jgi:3-hydroxyisobutyrate dehydrogenase-like beta-hydroxyacid dehydrogenase
MKIGLIGYGEVGRIFAEDLSKLGVTLNAFDNKLSDSEGDSLRAHAALHGVHMACSASEAVLAADLVICAVTASQTVIAARSCVDGIARNTKHADKYNLHTDRPPAEQGSCTYLDFNSVSPGVKFQCSEIVQHAGGRYVEAAIMTSVPPYRSQVPILLGGPYAEGLVSELNSLGFKASVASAKFGVSAAATMCRSVIIKGLESMVIESLTTARAYGVEDSVIASLYESFPGIDWEQQAAYFFQRVIEHGKRRSEEMLECAATVSEVGLTPWSATGSAERNAWMADIAERGVFGDPTQAGFARHVDWRIEADRILRHIKAS